MLSLVSDRSVFKYFVFKILAVGIMTLDPGSPTKLL